MNHFYAGQVIIAWWPPQYTRSYNNDIFIHWIQALAQNWIQHHSNQHYGTLDNVPGIFATHRALDTSHPALAMPFRS